VHSSELIMGRRFALVLEPGEELVGSVRAFCEREGISSAFVPNFFGAYRDMTLIGADAAPDDEEPPLPDRVTVTYTEGIGSGSIATAADGGVAVHLHAAVGRKSAGALAYAGHVMSAQVHYTTELVIEEVLSPVLTAVPVEASFGIPCLRFA